MVKKKGSMKLKSTESKSKKSTVPESDSQESKNQESASQNSTGSFRYIYYLIAAFILIKLILIFTRHHPLLWDEAVYLAIGKYIYSAGAVGLMESFRPIVLPLMLGWIWKLGFDYILVSDIIMLIFSAGCIYLVYRIGRIYMNQWLGLLSALIMALAPVFFYNSSRIMSGIPSMFFVLLAVYMFTKEKFGLAGFFTGIAFLFRFPNGIFLLVFGTMFLIMYARDRNFMINLIKLVDFTIPFVIVVLGYLIMSYYLHGSFFAPFLLALEHQVSGLYSQTGFWQNIFYYPYNLVYQSLFFIFIIISFIKPDRKKALLYLAFLFPFLYFTFVENKQMRFALAYLPFLSMLAVHGFARSVVFIRERFSKKSDGGKTIIKRTWPGRILRFVVYAILAVSLFDMVVYDYGLYKSFPAEEPAIVTEYNMFFADPVQYPANMTILTSDPVSAAYSDQKFIYFYDNVDRAAYRFDANINSADFVIYNEDAIYCDTSKCLDIKEHFYDTLVSEGVAVLNDTYDGEFRLIFDV